MRSLAQIAREQLHQDAVVPFPVRSALVLAHDAHLPEPDSPGVVLRLEGDPKTSFSGICTVGGKQSVLSGRVPKRYTFDPEGQRLLCRIQKQDPGGGSLKVILAAGDTTQSVQQTSVRGGVISISYKGG
jgi:hypothetical protein